MTARKATPKNDDAPTPAELEVAAEATEEQAEDKQRTFTFTFDGEDIELEDHWKREGKVPGGLPLLMAGGRDTLHFVSPVIKSIIGLGQMESLMDMGIAGDEWAEVAQAWLQGRGLGNGA